MNILSIMSLLFWMVIVPFCIGFIPCSFMEQRKRTPAMIFLSGYFLMWAVFGVIFIPIIVFVIPYNFTIATNLFMVVAVMMAIAGIVMYVRGSRMNLDGWMIPGRHRKRSIVDGNKTDVVTDDVTGMTRKDQIWLCLEWLIFFALLGFQLYKAVCYTSFDGDDAYYVVQSAIAQQANVMYYILPYTGGATSLDTRHALAVFPMWVAFVSAKSGIHSTIVSHSVMPILLIPLSYIVFYQVGRVLFDQDDKKDTSVMFLILMAVFQIFGYVSLYTNETFFLTRTWQGKAIVGSLIIPAMLWILLEMFRHYETAQKGMWLLLVCVNMCAGVCSSIAVFLVTILMGLVAVFMAISRRQFKILLQMACVCIPNVLYVALYVGLTLFYAVE